MEILNEGLTCERCGITGQTGLGWPSSKICNKCQPKTNRPILDRIAEERDLCRNEGANDIADLLDEAAKTIDEMWNSLTAYGYAVGVIRRECGLSDDPENLSDIYDYIIKLKGKK